MPDQPDSTPTEDEKNAAEAVGKLPLFKKIVAEMSKPAKAVKIFPKKGDK